MFFAEICCKFLAFFAFLEKNAASDYFNQSLECIATGGTTHRLGDAANSFAKHYKEKIQANVNKISVDINGV